ncbi:MAG: isocitrate/isopropylmalate family dehydrogenase [Tepidanaerobacteraceae bacterium]
MEYSFGEKTASEAVKSALERALDEGYRTADIQVDAKQIVSSSEMGDVIAGYL